MTLFLEKPKKILSDDVVLEKLKKADRRIRSPINKKCVT